MTEKLFFYPKDADINFDLKIQNLKEKHNVNFLDLYHQSCSFLKAFLHNIGNGGYADEVIHKLTSHFSVIHKSLAKFIN